MRRPVPCHRSRRRFLCDVFMCEYSFVYRRFLLNIMVKTSHEINNFFLFITHCHGNAAAHTLYVLQKRQHRHLKLRGMIRRR